MNPLKVTKSGVLSRHRHPNAVHGFVLKELAETNIRVNCIAPAAIKTKNLDQMAPEFVQIMIDKSPMKRLGQVEEAAELVMWLSSSACTFNAGAVFDLSGGRATY